MSPLISITISNNVLMYFLASKLPKLDSRQKYYDITKQIEYQLQLQGACSQLYKSCLLLLLYCKKKMFSKNFHQKLLKYFDLFPNSIRWQHSATTVKLKPFKDIPGPPGV